jgi:hypothetical protein
MKNTAGLEVISLVCLSLSSPPQEANTKQSSEISFLLTSKIKVTAYITNCIQKPALGTDADLEMQTSTQTASVV